MRVVWVFVVGFAVLGCKDKDKQPSPAHKESAATETTQATAAPDRPSLAPGDPNKPAVVDQPAADMARDFEAEAEDPAWAKATEKSIRAVAPELTDLECHGHQCRATVTAATEDELVQKVERLSR